MDAYIWLTLIILGVIIEGATVGLVAIWFVLGFVAALIVSFFGVTLWIQIAVAVVVSALALYFTRPFIKKISNKQVTRTNADRFVGMEGVVTEDILDNSGKGRVEIASQSWAANSFDGSVILKGSKVKVESISGVKLIVIPSDKE